MTWKFCNRRANNRITKLHERALRLLYDDYETLFSEFLAKDGSFTAHHTNVQTLLFESCFIDLFSAVNGNYNLRSQLDFRIPGINKGFYGANSIMYSGSMIWNSLPNDLRNICDFDLYKTLIQRWKSVDCPCRLCKHYLDGLGFINVSS